MAMNALERRRLFLDAIYLSLLAFFARVLVSLWAWDKVPPTADGAFYHVVAQRIAQGDGYTWLWPDGVVTYAAHYPVGYPALMGAVYFLLGPVPGFVMILNAGLGSVAVFAVHGLCVEILRCGEQHAHLRAGALIATTMVALSPTLIAYTPALMTEGAVGALLIVAARLALEVRRPEIVASRRWISIVAIVFCVGFATLLRPQSIVFAPIVGFLASAGKRLQAFSWAAVVTVGSLLVVVPWTLRNCDKMERCVFVSANGGWNLLIGTFPEGEGAWVALEGERVPKECREVFQEAAKDKCFGDAGLSRIRESPFSWLKLSPQKLRATFDYGAAATEYLSASGAISERGRLWLSALELVSQRLFYLLGLLGLWSRASALGNGMRNVLGVIGVIGFSGLSVALGGFSALVLFQFGPQIRTSVGGRFGMASMWSTALIHAVFFGAGRYSLPILFAVAPFAALGGAWIGGIRAPKTAGAEDFDSRSGVE